jgi:NhaP-type Na+/H+ or K+/H+ antiporter
LSPVILGLVVGVLAGPVGLKLLQPHIPEDAGLIETVTQVALLVTLFCVGLRLRFPLEWSAWRLPLRLAGMTLAATALLAAAVGHLLLDLSLLPALLLGIVVAPTDAVLACDIHVPADGEVDSPGMILATEGAIASGAAAPLVMLVLPYVGGDGSPEPSGWPLPELVWSLVGSLVCGWLIGAVMARWIRMLDPDRQGDFLEEMIVLATAILAYICALALRTEGLLSVLAAGLALSHGGRLQHTLQRPAIGPRALKLAGRLERLATVVVMVLLGALVSGADSYLRGVLLAGALLLLLRPVTVRAAAATIALTPGQRRPLEWFGARGAASLYCLALAINHGLGASTARELAAVTPVFILVSIVFSAVSALSLRRASPGAVDL